MAFNVKKNILHDYASYSYKFTLYAVPVDECNRLKQGDEGISLTDIHTKKFSKKVILMESGSTAININNVSITSYPSDDFSDVTHIRIQALQTKGYSLFESIIKAAEMCDVPGNAITGAFYLLELSFNGISDNGVVRNNIFTITYIVNINDIKTNITGNGVSYDITLSPNSLVSKEDSFATIPTLLALEDVKDTDSFFTKLENAINEAYRRDTTQGQAIVNTCRFVVDSRLLGHEFKIADGSSPISDYSLSYQDDTGPTFTIPAETPIPTIVEGVMANIPEIAKMLLNDDAIGYIVYVEPLITQGDYVPSLNAYTRNVTWYVRLKSTYKITNLHKFDVNRQLNIIAANGDLSKVYDYFFTGTNTEVINVDLDFSSLFSSTILSYQGIFENYAKQNGFAPSVVTSQDEELERESSESIQSGNKFNAKPVRVDGSGSNVYYVDTYDNVDMDMVKLMSARLNKAKANSNTTGSTSTPSNDSMRIAYDVELKNLRNLTYKADMLGKATLEIRGDPHWLVPKNVYIKPDSSHSDPRQLNLIYLRMGLPVDDTNIKVNIDKFMSKMYQVTEVSSEFNNGKFIQKLKGVGIAGIETQAIERKIK